MTDHGNHARVPVSALVLGITGLIPFAGGALTLWMPALVLGAGQGLLISYGAIILTFLGGVRWGTAMGPYDGRRQGFEFTVSVLGSLVGLAALFLPAIPALTLLIAGFLVHALWDVRSVEAGRLPSWYGKLRMMLTIGAELSLILGLIAVTVT